MQAPQFCMLGCYYTLLLVSENLSFGLIGSGINDSFLDVLREHV